MLRYAMRNEIFLKRLCDMLSVVYKYFKFFLILIVKTLNNFIFRTLRGINGIPMNVIDMLSAIIKLIV